MAVTSSVFKANIKVVEELDSGVDFTVATGADKAITHILNLDESQVPGGAVPVTKVVAKEFALSAGALTVNFASILGTNGVTHDMSGLRLQHLMLKNKTGNAAMTFAKGASNGYTGLGSAFSITLLAKQAFIFLGQEAAAEVASGDRTIDVSGTGTQSFQLVAVFG